MQKLTKHQQAPPERMARRKPPRKNLGIANPKTPMKNPKTLIKKTLANPKTPMMKMVTTRNVLQDVSIDG